MSLYKLLESGYGDIEDLNCAEKILYGANKVYNLGLDKNALKLSAGFGGGMGIESVCGALTASIMVLSYLFVENVAHESTRIKNLSRELFDRYEKKMGYIDCTPLKYDYRTEIEGCHWVILEAAKILDEIIAENTNIEKVR
ncbi:MAG: hypothetical protein GX974_04175 [Clostridiales bacterium]|nr:hypothetical protein [Clostridiales bacterium]